MLTSSKYARAAVLVGWCCLFALAGCDSDGSSDPDPNRTEFLVRYELTGSCVGIQTTAYSVNGGGIASATFALPWSFESEIMVSPDPATPTAVAISAICQGDGSTMQSLLARILVDGEERARQSAEGTTQLSVSVGIPLR